MANLVDDLPASELRFHFKAGRPCLNLCATVGERWRRHFERLRDEDDLARWLVESTLLRPPFAVSGAQLDAARQLRDAIYRVARRAGEGRPGDADVRCINAWAARPALSPQLAGTGRLGASATGPQPVEAALATLARDAVDLVTGPYAGRVRECAADDCALLFVDVSRPGRRRWCAMTACGNRQKTAAYRRRAKETRG